MTFGTRLRKQREKKRLSQKEVAELLGVWQATYCNWETDTTSFQVKYLLRLAELFDVSVIELIPEGVNAKPETFNAKQKGIIDKENLDDIYSNLLKSKDEIIQLLKEENKRLKANITQLEEVIGIPYRT
ncbi:helix-turn-helix domain-containing protein [Spirosoma aerolatum]|uniref:helix-turn-helix domain-containing protein n=1 Tax=Spirosoma aerolatum TaxID=1211326 RepID=UPI0009AEE103|nr:helix-turn-helix transcriptional regulator [Spirosoma aerolatum]